MKFFYLNIFSGRKISGSLLAFLFFVSFSVNAQDIDESFIDITTLAADGWTVTNNSDATGSTSIFQGNPVVFPANSGAGTEYLGMNFNATAGSVVDLWLVAPQREIQPGAVYSFFTRTVAGTTFPDRVEVRLSKTGTGVGATGGTGGDFSILLETINPNLVTSGGAGAYPETFTQFTYTLDAATMAANGINAGDQVFFAWRYFVTNGGPAGANSNFIGFDDFIFTEGTAVVAPPAPVEPIPTMSEWGLMIFGLLVLNLGVMFVYKKQNAVL